MKIIYNKKKLIKLINNERNLGFVPTMGAIHNGHKSLIRKSNYLCNKTIVSIFVNKPQFNKKKDFSKYPKKTKQDIAILKKMNVNFLYLPTNKEIYPNGINKKIKIISLGKKLCGKFRPGHFEAVADVIERFVKIIKPKKIFLGEKDMQQLLIVKNFLKNKYKETKVINCKTIREKNGIAYSSRNLLLSKEEKYIGSKIYKLIKSKKIKLIKKKISIKNLKKKFLQLGVKRIDYIKLININKLINKNYKIKKYKIFICYYLGQTRLIDNI